MKSMNLFIIILFVLAPLWACNDENINEIDSPVNIPDNILANSLGLYPEGIAFDTEEQVFYLSSIRKGKVVKSDLEGNVEVFVQDDKLRSVLGLSLNPQTRQLAICNADPGFAENSAQENPPTLANVLVYDLATGQELADYDLSTLTPEGQAHLVNDVVFDAAGNLYATDSFTPAIYKITPQGEQSILLLDESLAPTPGNFGLNGIEVHPDGFLIVGQYQQGKLYRIPLDNPTEFSEIVLDSPINSVDGILLEDENTITIVSNILDLSTGLHNKIHRINSTDNWDTAQVQNTIDLGGGTEFPTTLTQVNNEPYVVFSFLLELQANNSNVAEFDIKKVVF